MRRLLPVLFVLFGIVSLAQARELRVAVGILVANQQQSGGLSAFNEDLAREICRRINVRCKTSHMLFAEILPGIEAGQIDLGLGNFLRTPEREKRVGFSDAIWRSSSRLIGSHESAVRFAGNSRQEVTLAALRQARIVTVINSTQQAYLKQIAGEQGLTVLAVDTMDEVFVQLRQGKADFGLLPMLSAYSMLHRDPGGGLEFVGQPLVDNGLGGTVHMALPKDDEALRLSVNQGIAELRADGTYHRIVRRHFPFSLD